MAVATAASFATYRKPKRRRGGTCQKCGAQSAGRVAITLQAKEQVEGRTSKDANATRWPAIDSTSMTFCEPCAIEVYESAKTALPRD